MLGTPLFFILSLSAGNGTVPAHAGSLFLHANGGAIPAWARKYNMDCSGCHYPAPPRLNATGVRFRWAGYRMPEEIGEEASIQQVSNYVAVRGTFGYVYEKTKGEPAEENNFALEDASLFYGGAFGKNLGGFIELAKEEDETEAGVQVVGVWGKERSHGGFRVGQTHLLLNSGLAGFDRPAGISAPLAVSGPVTGSLPVSFGGDQAGAEVFYVIGRNRISGQLLGGTRLTEDGVSRRGATKDFVLSDQLLLDKNGAGIMGSLYLGSVGGVSEADASATAKFWRLALSASKVIHGFELQGGVVYGKDFDLPVGSGSPFTSPDNRGYGYWAAGQYVVAGPMLTVFGRYEFVDPDMDADQNGLRRFVMGSVLPLSLPSYLRGAVEFRTDRPQDPDASWRNSLAVQVLLSF